MMMPELPDVEASSCMDHVYAKALLASTGLTLWSEPVLIRGSLG